LGPKAPSPLQWSNCEPDSNPNASVSSCVRKFGVLCGLLRAVCKSYHRQRMRTSVTEAAPPSAGRRMQVILTPLPSWLTGSTLCPLRKHRTLMVTCVLDKPICFLPSRTGNRIAVTRDARYGDPSGRASRPRLSVSVPGPTDFLVFVIAA